RSYAAQQTSTHAGTGNRGAGTGMARIATGIAASHYTHPDRFDAAESVAVTDCPAGIHAAYADQLRGQRHRRSQAQLPGGNIGEGRGPVQANAGTNPLFVSGNLDPQAGR